MGGPKGLGRADGPEPGDELDPDLELDPGLSVPGPGFRPQTVTAESPHGFKVGQAVWTFEYGVGEFGRTFARLLLFYWRAYCPNENLQQVSIRQSSADFHYVKTGDLFGNAAGALARLREMAKADGERMLAVGHEFLATMKSRAADLQLCVDRLTF